MLAECQPDGSLTSPPLSLTEKIDLSFDEIVWRDEQRLLTTAEFRGEKPVFGITVSKPNVAEKAQGAGTFSSLAVSADGAVLVCNRSRLTAPPEVYAALLEPEILRTRLPGLELSRANAELLAQLDLPEASSVEVPGADGDPMQMWILQPPGFDKTRRWPLAFLVHGGPQAPGRTAGASAGILRSGPLRAMWSLLPIPAAALASVRSTPIRSAAIGVDAVTWILWRVWSSLKNRTILITSGCSLPGPPSVAT